MIVRRATEADVEAVVDLVTEVAAEEGRWIASEPPLDRTARRERLLAALESERSVSLVVVADDRLVGHLGMEVAPYGVAHFGMCVAAAWRGRGVGGALVAEAIESARRLGAHKVALEVWPHNAAARRLYRRYGFRDEGRLRRHYRRRDGQLWDAVVMGLVLDEELPGTP